jgi:hypothetical protein
LKKSRYFSDLLTSYLDEIDDLVSDSEGKSVLQKRLQDKRGEMAALLSMIDFSPEMVAVVFYDAYGFRSADVMQRLALSEPDLPGFLTWAELKENLTVAAWAEGLIESSLKVQGGDAFLVATAALEFLRNKDTFAAPAAEAEAGNAPYGKEEGDEDGDGEADDLGEAGADWLAEQGFETLDR